MEEFAHDLDTHPDFYVPFTAYKPSNLYLDYVASRLPKNWRLKQDYFWTYALSPKPSNLVQGWKIHVSAVHDSAQAILDTVTEVCTANATEFKFASDSFILRKLLSKNAARQAGGKFVTIYPETTAIFERILEDLYHKLEGKNGPYILSDRQYKDSKVIFYRYGGFSSFSQQDVMGRKKSLILNDQYQLIEDLRVPRFHLPAFVTDGQWGQIADEPSVNQENNNHSHFDGKYDIQSVIKYTNAGGIYIAKDVASDNQVIVKEARPFVGTDIAGIDAVTRLKKEYRILDKIKNDAIAPKPYGWFTEWEHSFLVQELVQGNTLREYCVQANKVIFPGCSDEDTRIWIETLIKISSSLIDKIRRLHSYNVVFGDLSHNNVIIDQQTLELRIIDFEGAVELGYDTAVNMYTPGFAPRARRDRKSVDFADDHFALGCIMLALVIPSSLTVAIKPEYPAQAFDMLRADIKLPDAYIECARYLMGTEPVQLERCLDILKTAKTDNVRALAVNDTAAEEDNFSGLVDAILSYNADVMDFTQPSRVFPLGAQFDDPFAVNHGVIGVAIGWHKIRGSVPPTLKEWLSKKFRADGEHSPGLLNGLSGTAWAFAEMGMRREAESALHAAALHRQLYESHCLGYGAAGYGLTNLYFWQQLGDSAYLAEATKIADILCDAAVSRESGVTWDIAEGSEEMAIGLNEGASGIALFLLYISCATQNSRYLEIAQMALDFDISCGETTQGTLGFPRRYTKGKKILYPYLEHGSAGVGTVALRMYSVTKNARYLDLINAIKPGVAQKYTITASLMTGLAGLGNYLLDAAEFTGDSSYRKLATRVAAGLKLFEIKRPSGSAFPARLSTKISCSYAAGSTGIALFLHRLDKGGRNFHFMLDDLLEQHRFDWPSAQATKMNADFVPPQPITDQERILT